MFVKTQGWTKWRRHFQFPHIYTHFIFWGPTRVGYLTVFQTINSHGRIDQNPSQPKSLWQFSGFLTKVAFSGGKQLQLRKLSALERRGGLTSWRGKQSPKVLLLRRREIPISSSSSPYSVFSKRYQQMALRWAWLKNFSSSSLLTNLQAERSFINSSSRIVNCPITMYWDEGNSYKNSLTATSFPLTRTMRCQGKATVSLIALFTFYNSGKTKHPPCECHHSQQNTPTSLNERTQGYRNSKNQLIKCFP